MREVSLHSMVRLYTFHVSHFAEKARWALDYEGIAYEEKVLMPGPHVFVMRRLANSTQVPALDLNGEIVQGSSAILDCIAERLGGSRLSPPSTAALALAQALEVRLDEACGVGTRRLLYAVMLKQRRTVTDLWVEGGAKWGRVFYALSYPAIAKLLRRSYQLDDAAALSRAHQQLMAIFDELDALLAKQAYLGGETPNRCDITLAALLSPLCRPPEHHVRWPTVPAELADLETSLRDRPTWQHVLRMYRLHRRSSPRATA